MSALLLMYNIGRTVLGSLVSNVFRPLLMLQQSRLLTSEISKGDAALFVFGQGIVTIFGFFSAITDIFLALTQVDVTMVAVGVTLLMDGFATHGILSSRIRCKKDVGSRDDSRGALKGRAPPATASAAAWRRTLPPMLPPTRKAGLGERPIPGGQGTDTLLLILHKGAAGPLAYRVGPHVRFAPMTCTRPR
jgi:hypothetical protein